MDLENGFDHDRVTLSTNGTDVEDSDVTTRHQIGLGSVEGDRDGRSGGSEPGLGAAVGGGSVLVPSKIDSGSARQTPIDDRVVGTTAYRSGAGNFNRSDRVDQRTEWMPKATAMRLGLYGDESEKLPAPRYLNAVAGGDELDALEAGG